MKTIIHRFSAGFTLLLGQGGKRSAIPQGANHFKNNQNLPGEENVGTGPGCHLFIMSRQIVYSDTDGGGSSPETVGGIGEMNGGVTAVTGQRVLPHLLTCHGPGM